MVRVKFFAQDLKDNTRTCTNELFFEEIDTAVKILINTQYTRLTCALPQFRVVCLIENLENE
jgi:hypothetical protein